ncbi:MAG: hypothetical protein H0U56_15540 [Methylibium sp.]|nr:hypothetical protein [Methylibium sp.]
MRPRCTTEEVLGVAFSVALVACTLTLWAALNAPRWLVIGIIRLGGKA